MKKYASVFGLFARSSLYKTLGILLLMCVAETALFLFSFGRGVSAAQIGRFEFYVGKGHFAICLLVAFLLLSVALCLPGSEAGARSGYTLDRLRVGEKAVFCMQALWNTLAYLLLWAAQLLAVYGLGRYYAAAAAVGQQSLFLAFYRSSFLHALLPLSDILLWVRNGMLIVALGLVTAEFPLLMRQKKYSFTVLPMVAVALFSFRQALGATGGALLAGAALLVVILKILYDFISKEAARHA